jgi:hypothetical protein
MRMKTAIYPPPVNGLLSEMRILETLLERKTSISTVEEPATEHPTERRGVPTRSILSTEPLTLVGF